MSEETARKVSPDEELAKRKERDKREWIEKEKARKLTPKAKGKIMTNVVSPRSYNYLKLKTKNDEGTVEIKPNMGTKEEALLDVIFDRFVKQDNLKAVAIPPLDGVSSWDRGRLDNAVRHRNDGGAPKINYVIELHSGEIRKALGLPHFTNKEIFETAESLARVLIKAEGVKIWADYYGKYEKTVTWIGHLIQSVKREKTDMIAPRTRNIQHRFLFVLEDSTTILFSNDAFTLRFSLFPKKFYRLAPGCQRLLRYLSLFSESHLNLKQIVEIVGWKLTSKSNLYNLKKRVEKILERMKQECFIMGWERKGKGKKTTWDIWGIDSTAMNIMNNLKPKEIKAFKVEDRTERTKELSIEAELVNRG